jgi:replicative DNA helicase
LKESSNIEQDADAVLLLHRPQGEDNGPDPFGCYTVLARIAKMRNGQTTEWDGPAAIRLRWNPRLTHFAEYARAEAQEDGGAAPVGAEGRNY